MLSLKSLSALSDSEAAGFHGFPHLGRTAILTDLGVMRVALGNATVSLCSYPKEFLVNNHR